MKVFDLQCAHEHVFEGWFASEDDFQRQLAQRLLTCPVCGEAEVRKLPSAARLNLGASEPPRRAAPSQKPVDRSEVQGLWMAAVRHLMANTEDVGTRFAEEARRIHHGDAPERGIRGQANAEESQALRDEGIEVLQLPLPDFAKETLQ
ncbi:hypothetical protein CCO03_05075 [Comamonas serinivorans]|uniref:DUF1178 domain-containing protein n=1 Tax=Comamonas serinivorans TaxID=1082851 RepID=A0A1Y0ESL2_9BURK|nr:DUF1178 family protein [Comamonas serinivorans]ARU06665.1 hypothetical protein CCO03_05075 [Comamonas serinivorans]